MLLTKVAGVIKPRTVFLNAVTAAAGANAKPTRVTEVELLLELDVTNSLKAIDALFPGADEYAKLVAGREKQCKGEDRTARTKLPEMNVRIFYGDDAEPAVDSQACPVKARPQLKVNEDGEARMIVKPRCKLANKQLTEMAQLIGADVRVTMEPAQVDLADVNMAEPEKPKRGKKNGDKPDLRVVDDPTDPASALDA